MISLEELHEEYKKYSELNEEYQKTLDAYDKFKIKNEKILNENIISHYNYVINTKNRILLNSVLEDYEIMREYHGFITKLDCYETSIEKYPLKCNIASYSGKYILLNENELGLSLVDLVKKEKLNINECSKDEIEFLVNILKYHDCYIGNMKQEELPFLMVLIENIDSGYMEDDCETIARKIEIARKYDKNNIEKSIDSYPQNTYELVAEWFKNGINIEEVYLNANNDDKKAILAAYYALSTYGTSDVRTASSIVNQDILKSIHKLKLRNNINS